MRRIAFLKFCAAVGSYLAAPFAVRATPAADDRLGKGLKVEAGKDRSGQPISLLEGDTFFTKVSTADTDGDIYVFESIRVKEGGPSFHLHYEQDEWWYVLKGEFLFKVGDETFTAQAGDSVFGPRRVPHAFAKVGLGEARLLMFFQPAGKMQAMFQKISAGVTKGMTEEEQDRFRHEHGIKRVGPAITHFKKW